MAERQTLITQGNTRLPPLAAPNVRAPSGAFGDYEGTAQLGRALSATGDRGAAMAASVAQQQARDFREEIDRRDASDIAARFRLVVNEEGLGLQQDYLKAVQEGVKHDALMKTVEEASMLRLKSIDARMAEMRGRNPRVFDRMITPDSKASAWMTRADNIAQQAVVHNAALAQAERFETATANDALVFANTSGNPFGALAAARNILHEMEATKDLFTSQQRMQRRAALNDHVAQTLLGNAQVRPDPRIIPESEKARDAGLITPTTHARIVDEIKHANNPKVISTELRGTANSINDRMRGGEQVSPSVASEALANAITTYSTNEARFNEVLKPHFLAIMEGSVRNNAGNGFMVGGTLRSSQTLAAELAKPESQMINDLFAQGFKAARDEAKQSLPILAGEIEATKGMVPSASDFASYKQALTSTLSKQLDMVENYRAHELYERNPGVVQAIKGGSAATLVRVQRDLYDRDGVPEDRRIYGDPAEIRALQERMKLTDEASVNQTAQMLDGFVLKYGRDSYGALIASARAPSPISGVTRFVAQQFLALNKEAEHDIAGIIPELVQAVSWAGSNIAATVQEKNPDFKKQTDIFWNAAMSAGYAGEFDAKAAFGDYLDNDLRASPETSPLGQAALREGTYDALHSLGAALTKYYAAGKKDELLRPNEAAAKARQVLDRAFIPVSSTGGGAEKPVYTFAPVTTRQTDWYLPGTRGAFNNQRHYAQMEEAAWDSMFLTQDPKLGLGGTIQWQFNLAITHLLNGPRLGFNTELAQMPELNPAFSTLVRSSLNTKAFNTRPIDFANLGILSENEKGEEVFTPLSEDRIVTDYLPVTVKERVDALLKKTDPTDIAGRNQLVLANAFQREINPKTSSWDVYLRSGRSYAGTAGTLHGLGPRASVVVKQSDGTFKKLSIPVVESDNRLEALMAASSSFDRAKSNDILRRELIDKETQSIINLR